MIESLQDTMVFSDEMYLQILSHSDIDTKMAMYKALDWKPEKLDIKKFEEQLKLKFMDPAAWRNINCTFFMWNNVNPGSKHLINKYIYAPTDPYGEGVGYNFDGSSVFCIRNK